MLLRCVGGFALGCLLFLQPEAALAQRAGPAPITLLFQGGGEAAIVRAETGQTLCQTAGPSARCSVMLRPGETMRIIVLPAAGSGFVLWQGPCGTGRSQASPECVITGSGSPMSVQAFVARSNDASAISELRTLVSARAMFYQSDVEADDEYDYSSELRGRSSEQMTTSTPSTRRPPH